MEFLLTKIKENLNEQMILLTISNPRKAEEVKKYNIRPILVKDKLVFQSAAYTKTQVFHKNLSKRELLEEVQKCIDEDIIKDKVIVQAGSTKFESKDMEVFNLIEQDKFNILMEQADTIITHGGVGSIVTAVKLGKKVIAVPRLKQYGEHVNDHQIQIVETFSNQGFIKGIKDVSELKETLREIDTFIPNKLESNTEHIINIIEDFIQNV